MANCFYRTRPELKVGPNARIFFLGNDGARLSAAETKEGADDSLPKDALASVAQALDDLRRLGETDLRLNYGK